MSGLRRARALVLQVRVVCAMTGKLSDFGLRISRGAAYFSDVLMTFGVHLFEGTPIVLGGLRRTSIGWVPHVDTCPFPTGTPVSNSNVNSERSALDGGELSICVLGQIAHFRFAEYMGSICILKCTLSRT